MAGPMRLLSTNLTVVNVLLLVEFFVVVAVTMVLFDLLLYDGDHVSGSVACVNIPHNKFDRPKVNIMAIFS